MENDWNVIGKVIGKWLESDWEIIGKPRETHWNMIGNQWIVMGNDDWKMMDDDDFQWFASIFMVMNKNLNGFSGVSSQRNSDVKDVWRDFGFFLILGLKQGLLSLEGISKRRLKQPPFSLRKVLLCALRAPEDEMVRRIAMVRTLRVNSPVLGGW